MIAQSIATMQRHVLELRRLVDRMDPGEAKERIRARYEESLIELNKLRALKSPTTKGES